MKYRLDANMNRGGWEDCHIETLIRLAKHNLADIDSIAAQMDDSTVPRVNPDYRLILRHAADLANFAMMIADNYGGPDSYHNLSNLDAARAKGAGDG